MIALPEMGVQTAPIGRTVAGKYFLEECIGVGAHAVVYRAFGLHVGRYVALKTMRGTQDEFPELAARFRQEAAALAELRNCGVADLVEDGINDEGAPYIAMELLEGKTLRAHLDDYRRLTTRDAVIITIRLARVLDLLHGRGYVHRDVKPDNVFLESSQPERISLRLLDLGSARRVLNQRSESGIRTKRGLGGPSPFNVRTTPGMVLGTPRYMSPEQCTAGAELDQRSDVYSLGVVFYELLAGAPPFPGKDPGRLANAHWFIRPPVLAQHDVSVSPRLEAALMKALEKAPEKRFETMGNFACALADAAREEARHRVL
jgi:serine/threonine protein kinase